MVHAVNETPPMRRGLKPLGLTIMGIMMGLLPIRGLRTGFFDITNFQGVKEITRRDGLLELNAKIAFGFTINSPNPPVK